MVSNNMITQLSFFSAGLCKTSNGFSFIIEAVLLEGSGVTSIWHLVVRCIPFCVVVAVIEFNFLELLTLTERECLYQTRHTGIVKDNSFLLIDDKLQLTGLQ